MSDKTFIKITNKNIFDSLNNLDKKIDLLILQQKETNGKVKLNRWIATTAMTITIAMVIAFITFRFG